MLSDTNTLNLTMVVIVSLQTPQGIGIYQALHSSPWMPHPDCFWRRGPGCGWAAVLDVASWEPQPPPGLQTPNLRALQSPAP